MAPDAHPEHSDITNEMWSKIDEIIVDNKDIPGSIIGVLRECQDVVGWLPVELIDYISDGLNLSPQRGFWNCFLLFTFLPDTQRPAFDQGMHGHRLLCEGH